MPSRLVQYLDRFNSRHPWSHNDHFHRWIGRNLPARRNLAVDFGCGRGELVSLLAGRFTDVIGTDRDAAMRTEATRRCAGLSNVTIDDAQLDELSGPVDLVTMVAVLHHLDVPAALVEVERLLAPGGRFLVVGLAARSWSSVPDVAWELASVVTNPVIGLVKHPLPVRGEPPRPPFPVRDAELSFDQLRSLVDKTMPGARMRRRLAFRHTIVWTKPEVPTLDR